MTTAHYAHIHAMVQAEAAPVRRNRLEQFIYALVCAWPNYSIHHAAQAAVQLARPIQIHRAHSLEAVERVVKHLDLRPGEEWEVLGYPPRPDALPILLSDPRDETAPPIAHYLREDVADPETGTHPSYEDVPGQTAHIAGWRQRRGNPDSSQAAAYRGFHPALTEDHTRMLGNLWKIGAVAVWERDSSDAASWAELIHPPAEGESAAPDMTEHDSWYRFRISSHMGRDCFAEIALCLGNVYCRHLPQVWRENSADGSGVDRQVVLLESEAAGSIAVSRVGGPVRRGSSFFRNALTDDEPLPRDVHLPTVLHAAEQIQALLQGDSSAVTATAWFADDPRS